MGRSIIKGSLNTHNASTHKLKFLLQLITKYNQHNIKLHLYHMLKTISQYLYIFLLIFSNKSPAP